LAEFTQDLVSLFAIAFINRLIIFHFRSQYARGDEQDPIYNGFLFNRIHQQNPGPSTLFLPNQFNPQTSLHLTLPSAVPLVSEIPSMLSVVQSPSRKILSTSQSSNAGRNCWSSIETRTLILSYQEHAEALTQAKSPQRKRAIWQTILQAFRDSYQDNAIESVKTLTQLKEKWKSLVEKYKKIKDNNKATGRWRESFEFFKELDSLLGCQDKISPRYMCKTDICTDSPDKDSSTGESTSTSTSARSSNYDGEECEEVDDDKATQAKTPEGLLKKAEKHKAGKKQEAGPNRRKMGKQKKTDKRESLIELLQGQQEMMVTADE